MYITQAQYNFKFKYNKKNHLPKINEIINYTSFYQFDTKVAVSFQYNDDKKLFYIIQVVAKDSDTCNKVLNDFYIKIKDTFHRIPNQTAIIEPTNLDKEKENEEIRVS